MINKSEKEIELLFETSWEVCNKIGGIYTVLSTKARELQEVYGDRLIFIGPDVWSDDNPSPSFIERKKLHNRNISDLNLLNGINIRVGRWNIPGSPLVILVKFHEVFKILNEVYGKMWEKYGVESINAYGDYDESCAFAIASALVIKNLTEFLNIDPAGVIAHFDEWTTGMGLLYLKTIMPEASTIFTTHATSIGRSICGNGKALYQYFNGYNGDQMARELNMEAKHSLEKMAAHNADCFTTVSEVTAKECTQLLDITPAVITPNGFEPDFVPTEKKYAVQRKKGRERLIKVASVLANKSLSDDTFIIVTSGRNEYRNKGIDLFIDAMQNLQNMESVKDKDIIALILVPAWVRQPAGDLLMDLEYEGNEIPEIPYLTHRLNNEESDRISCRLRELHDNGAMRNLKIIFVPCYLDGHDGIVNLSYYDLLPAIDLSVFPSYYEPWGYTPLESIAFGVPTITTDKAGFGQWVLSSFSRNDLLSTGVKVINREDTTYHANAREIASEVAQYLESSPALKKSARNNAVMTSRKADWKIFINDYYKAFQIALKNSRKRNRK